MNPPAKDTVVFQHVSKRYRLGSLGSLRGTVSSLLSSPRDEDASRILWALRDVSFRVEPGESLGLIGPNGAGKTTALKLLSNITRPTNGSVSVTGRVSSLIELGAGFHPELTGRENIYLNGAILGLTRQEIARRFDAIVAFSELERFLDTPIKRYSSGMYVRLGFAVAAHVEPDVLLVDEVLAVGDSAFRQKCMVRMEALRADGTTLLFVSHNMYQVRRLCSKALLLMRGQAVFLGPTNDAISAYEETIQSDASHSHELAALDYANRSEIFIKNVILYDDKGGVVTKLHHKQTLEVCASYLTTHTVFDPIVKVRLVRIDGMVAAMSASRYSPNLRWTLQGNGTIRIRFNPIQLASGKYAAEIRVIDTTDTTVLASGHSAPFLVQGPGMLHEIDVGAFVPNVSWNHQPEHEVIK